MKLESERIGVTFDARTGTLAAVVNKLTDETFAIGGDDFAIDLLDRRVTRADCAMASLDGDSQAVRAAYDGGGMRVEATYRLRDGQHFIEKCLTIRSAADEGVRKVTPATLAVRAERRISLWPYRHQRSMTCFGRTSKGGWFAGIETADDASWCDGQEIGLAYCPNLKLPAGRVLDCEAMFFGVYARAAHEGDAQYATEGRDCTPLPSESRAMVAMTTALFDKPAQDLVTLPILWNCRLGRQDKLASRDELEEDQRVFDYLKECGFQWSHEFNPWGGEFVRVAELTGDDALSYDPMQTELLAYGRQRGLRLVLWATMTNAHPWRGGKPFRPDRPQWRTSPLRVRFVHGGANNSADDARAWRDIQGNCFGHAPFVDWLERMLRERLDSGLYDGFSLDGDFVGLGGQTALRCPCTRDDHDHLPGDAHYACQRAVARMLHRIRRDYPRCCIWLMRPMMDLGVWALRDATCAFTIDEFGKLDPLPKLAGQPANVICGDKIRVWSRIRLHRHFLPHHLDQPLVFPYTGSRVPGALPWTSQKIDYLMLSALSCSPNHACYLPPAQDMPAEDRATLRHWLDWGRAHLPYLFVRRDLSCWPSAGSVDGSAHIVDGHGFVFLFNPNKSAVATRFDLTDDCLGLTRRGEYTITQHYPASDRRLAAAYGQTVDWTVEGASAIILELQCVGHGARKAV